MAVMSKESDAGSQCFPISFVRCLTRAGFLSVSTMYQNVDGMVLELDLSAIYISAVPKTKSRMARYMKMLHTLA